jgi:hypothetical protein
MLPHVLGRHEHTRPLQERFCILLVESKAPAGVFLFMVYVMLHEKAYFFVFY